jgi:hypothetical protein
MAAKMSHLLDGIVPRGECGTHGVPNLVVCNQRLALTVNHRGALHAGHNSVDAVVDLLLNDKAHRNDCEGLVREYVNIKNSQGLV